ncbi:GntR family transcriptional regulator / MocR family aminotransferase [Thermomonospora echinospora]|uniref:GntR family transcriptional regulator / MocR family aminotransferase n=1 Tax=Thermomonospora echinospora TaxID=1992 RepID=A0A1H6A9V5_9ACTN|nr:PLP-dependent aminotransferase family protein [Thermomonospora echinospora]SEG45529.1 GntR family transcriptional regulator / MocR family aminotransferase [Thermomonospora echinospora]
MTDLHLPLDPAAGRLSAQLAAGLRAAVRDGRLAGGTRLPSSRDLARDLGVSRGVVVTAYEQLVAEGFLVSRRGDGTRVAPLARPDLPPLRSAPVWPDEEPAARAGTSPCDLRPGPDLSAFPRELWAAAIRTALRTIPSDALSYPEPSGAAELRGELAGYLGRVRAAHAVPERIVVMNGVAHVISSVVRLLAAAGHTVLAVEDPSGHRQPPMLEAAGVGLVRIPVDAHGIDVAALAASPARAVLVTPAHQYPTGVVLAPGRRAELIQWARAVNGLVIEDDYDAEFRYDRSPVGCLQGLAPERVVLAGSVSKSLAPALRLGWAVVPASLAERLRMHRMNTDIGGPVLEQHALAHLLASGAYDRHLRAMRRRYRARRDALAGALAARLPDVRVQGVAAGLHLYVELPAGCDEEKVVAEAAHHGLLLQGAAPMWSRPAKPALVIGYARVNETRLRSAVDILDRVIARGIHG